MSVRYSFSVRQWECNDMGKYSPLKEFLTGQKQDFVPMTFAEIEEVLDLKLPSSKQYPAWWSNNPSNNPMTKEWLDAGFETTSVNIGSERLIFRRVRKNTPRVSADNPPAATDSIAAARPRRHPIFGCMKGTLTLLPEVDLTEPADTEWGKVYE